MVPRVRWLCWLLPAAVVLGLGLNAPDIRTGNGVLSIDLDQAYQVIRDVEVMRIEKRNRGGGLTTKLERKRWQGKRLDVGNRASRCFASDFSGRSGAPALFVFVDRVSAKRGKTWVMHVPGLAEKRRGRARIPATTKASVDGSSFTLRQGDATLKATFVAPADLRLECVQGKLVRAWGRWSKYCRGYRLYRRNGIEASGDNGRAGEFFVIMTFQKGKPPEVKVHGEGLGAHVTVGAQTVSFDGKKIILGAQ